MKHTHLYFALLALLIAMPRLAGAQTARDYFLRIPDRLMPLLTAVNRADCIDFLDSRMRAEVTNRLRSKSEMTELTTDYIRLRLSEQSTWQLKVLAVSDSTQVLCVVHTVAGTAEDSRVEFYDMDWSLLPAERYMPAMPTLADYLAIPVDSALTAAQGDALKAADMLLCRIDASPTEPQLTLTFTTPDYLNADARAELQSLLRPAPVMVWTAEGFRRRD